MRKGFTLIELLAVIVILAIILLIALPVMSGVIERAKRDSFFNSVNVLIKEVERDFEVNSNSKSSMTYEFSDFEEVGDNKLGLRKSNIKDGYITIKSDGVVIGVLTDGENVFVKSGDSDDFAVSSLEPENIKQVFIDLVSDYGLTINGKVIVSHDYNITYRYLSGTSGPSVYVNIISAIDEDGNQHVIEHSSDPLTATGSVLSTSFVTDDIKGAFLPIAGSDGRFKADFYHNTFGVDIEYLGELTTVNFQDFTTYEVYSGNYSWSSNVGGSGASDYYRYTYYKD